MSSHQFPHNYQASFALPQYDYMPYHDDQAFAPRDNRHASPSSPTLSDAETFAGSGSPAPSSVCSPPWQYAITPQLDTDLPLPVSPPMTMSDLAARKLPLDNSIPKWDTLNSWPNRIETPDGVQFQLGDEQWADQAYHQRAVAHDTTLQYPNEYNSAYTAPLYAAQAAASSSLVHDHPQPISVPFAPQSAPAAYNIPPPAASPDHSPRLADPSMSWINNSEPAAAQQISQDGVSYPEFAPTYNPYPSTELYHNSPTFFGSMPKYSGPPFNPYSVGISPALIQPNETFVPWDQSPMDGFEDDSNDTSSYPNLRVHFEPVKKEEDADDGLRLLHDQDDLNEEDEEDEPEVEDDDEEWQPSPRPYPSTFIPSYIPSPPVSSTPPSRLRRASTSSAVVLRPRRGRATSSSSAHVNTFSPPPTMNQWSSAPSVIPHLTKRSRGRQVPTIRLDGSEEEVKAEVEDEASSPVRSSRRRVASSNRRAVMEDATGRPRMYVCKINGCGKCFQRGEHLKRHIRSIHTNEKPYKCPHPGCGKDFSRRDNLLQHTSIHARNAPK